MKYKNICDCHTHSNNSFDGKDDMEVMISRAGDLGLGYFAITDHCECNDFEKYEGSSQKSFDKMQGAEAGRIKLIKGVELGQPMQNLQVAKAVTARDYDFILASVHNVKDREDFYWIDYEGISKHEIRMLLKEYFLEVLSMLGTDPITGEDRVSFDSLAHLTYPLRYIEGNNKIKVEMSEYAGIIDDILKTVIRSGRAIEVNTSGYRQEIGKAIPDLPFVKRYRELGGEYVTIGSDAHTAQDIGKGIEKGMDMLVEAGFTHYTVFVDRKPILIEIKED